MFIIKHITIADVTLTNGDTVAITVDAMGNVLATAQCHNERKGYTATDRAGGSYDLTQRSAYDLATVGRDALLNGYAVLFVDEPRRLGQAKRRAATVVDTLAALIVEKACECVANGDVPAHCLKGDAGILFAYACQE